MKKFLLAVSAVTYIFSPCAMALTLQPGESFEYSIQPEYLTLSADTSEKYENYIIWDISPGNVGDKFQFEMFENIDFSGSLQSFSPFVDFGGIATADPYYSNNIAWLDKNGSVRFTAKDTSLEINSISFRISTPTGSYSLSVAPQAVPEASSFVFFMLGLSLMAGKHFRRRNIWRSSYKIVNQAPA